MRMIGDVIAGRTLHVVLHTASAREAAQVMATRQASSLPVVEGKRLVGIVTERDLVHRVMAARLDPAVTLVAQVMSTRLVTAHVDDSYEKALGKMKRNHVRHLLIVEGGHLVGVVSMRDLLVVDAAEKSDEIQLLTSYIYAVPPVLPPFESVDDEWVHTL